MKNQDEKTEAKEHEWPGDVLGRRKYSEFLTTVLTQQTKTISEKQQRGLTIALDADWGAGKTFFVEHWKEDLCRQGFPVVLFDAWKNDLGEEPAVALMAAINAEIQNWVKRLPVGNKASEIAKQLSKKSIRQLRRVIVPATGIIATAMLKKFTGISLKALSEVYADISDEDESSDELENPSASPHKKDDDKAMDAEKEIENSLDKIFEKTLQAQDKRIDAIELFKKTMAETVDLLQREADAKTPVFIFIDELDRCRPSYAISLLEEIKHIFGMPNVCFVVSMNLAQLTHSVRAVYGPGFDGEHYLKRFFDQIYTIPLPDNKKHIEFLLAEYSLFSERILLLGLPTEPCKANTPRHAIALIFDAFNLDLRSQKQVFQIAETAATAIENQKPIYLLWLFFLCALIHKSQKSYSELTTSKIDKLRFSEIIQPIFQQEKEISYNENRSASRVSLINVLWCYYCFSNMTANEIQQRYDMSTSSSYPESNIRDIQSEIPGSYMTNNPPIPSIRNYIELVKYAGYNQA